MTTRTLGNIIMTAKTKVTINLGKLHKIRDEMQSNFVAKVGIMGSKASEMHQTTTGASFKVGSRDVKKVTSSGLSNVQLGVIHEFGSHSRNIPARSFLRMPLETKRKELMEFLGSKLAVQLIEEGNIKRLLLLLGIKAEAIIQSAFETSGFGTWQANTPETIARKGSSSPLIDTAQLRRSITSKVVKK